MFSLDFSLVASAFVFGYILFRLGSIFCCFVFLVSVASGDISVFLWL
ncbi:unnamed protein product [Arabidopsis halleri]